MLVESWLKLLKRLKNSVHETCRYTFNGWFWSAQATESMSGKAAMDREGTDNQFGARGKCSLKYALPLRLKWGRNLKD